MSVRDDSTLHHVVINFTQRTIELHGDDGEYKTVTCDWTERGCQEFENLVKYCQDQLPSEMRTYQL
jgi:hypothetical protein